MNKYKNNKKKQKKNAQSRFNHNSLKLVITQIWISNESAAQQVNKLIYSSSKTTAGKRSIPLTHGTTWMNFENIMVSERS
jgi:hypothetical protein